MHYNMFNKYRLSTYCGLLLLVSGNSRERDGQSCLHVADIQWCAGAVTLAHGFCKLPVLHGHHLEIKLHELTSK